ncbi:CHAD domain-containing protein [Photobacterium sanctipauli]|uniref:CHAD domain-containing protein n=1 Tax=Photobacterium sanctipauli TaxID=1342794 RepID=A0A2T3NWD1_9GAMM|nr:CHAD domain-containing protein [Photobacterium sanctipauli]PSW20529.1 CHAD domain-containing protein [Photobacterium sanctipauli]
MTVTKRDQLKLPKRKKASAVLNTSVPLPNATNQFLINEFNHARNHEAGIIRDDHDEFLHQYRVSLRRCRALLALLKPLFPQQSQQALKIELKGLMQHTNLLRDLDVFLLKMDDYFYELEHCHHQGLTRFFDELQDQRRQAFKTVRKQLKSEGYQHQCVVILEQLEQQSKTLTKSSDEESQVFAQQLLWKHFKVVESDSQRLDAESPDEDIHQLRIDCKKLRYLLEFFSPLLPAKAAKTQVSQLKLLQDKLGEFNDLSVQLAFFTSYLSKQKPSSKRYLAITELLSLTQDQHRRARAETFDQLGHFLAPAHLDLYYALYPDSGED